MLTNKGVMMFEYTRGTEYSVIVCINEITGSTTFHREKYPPNCTKEVKRAFLDEADKAAMIQLMKIEEEAWSGA